MVSTHYTTKTGEVKAVKAAVHLAQYVLFGTESMRTNTAASLDEKKMKNIILGNYGIKRCAQDRSALWRKCKKPCKNLRYNK